jgi:hypothetical protein
MHGFIQLGESGSTPNISSDCTDRNSTGQHQRERRDSARKRRARQEKGEKRRKSGHRQGKTRKKSEMTPELRLKNTPREEGNQEGKGNRPSTRPTRAWVNDIKSKNEVFFLFLLSSLRHMLLFPVLCGPAAIFSFSRVVRCQRHFSVAVRQEV